MVNAIANYMLERLREFSTWRGLAALAATTGVLIAPVQLDAAYKAFVAVLGLVAVVSPNPKGR